MATSEALGSDGLIPSKCGPCNNAKKNSEATMFCMECNNMLCDACVGMHKIFPTMKSHKIVVLTDKDQYEYRARLLTDLCERHDNKQLETFCKTHRELCCSVCVSLNHRNCNGLVYLPEYANEEDAGKMIFKVKLKLEKTKVNAENLRTLKQADGQRTDVEKAQTIKGVDDYRGKLKSEIDRIHEQSVTEITCWYDSHRKSIEKDVKTCEDVVAEGNEALKTLQDEKNTKVQTFIGASRLDAIAVQAQEKVDSISGKDNEESTIYKIQTTMKEELKNTQSFGKFAEAEFENKIGPKIGEHVLPKGTERCNIYKIGSVRDQHLLLADWSDKNLKICDNQFQIIENISLHYCPRGFCLINSETVCVSYQNEKRVQIASVNGTVYKVVRTIDIGRVCRGVSYKNGNLYVACGEENDAELRMYSTEGTLKNRFGKGQLSAPYCVNTNQDGSTVFVGDDNKGVIAIDSGGTLLWIYNEKNILKRVWDIAVDENNDLYVCGYSSNNIVKVTSDGRKGEVLLGGIENPKTLCYDRRNKRLFIAYGNNKVLVHEVIRQAK